MAILYAEKNKICVSTDAWSFRLCVKEIEKSLFNTLRTGEADLRF